MGFVGPLELPTANILSYSSLEIVDLNRFQLAAFAAYVLRAQSVQPSNVGYVGPLE
jgi:hypothetical protein